MRSRKYSCFRLFTIATHAQVIVRAGDADAAPLSSNCRRHFVKNIRRGEKHTFAIKYTQRQLEKNDTATLLEYDKCGMNPLYLVLALFIVMVMMAAYGHKSLRRLQEEVSVLH